MESHTESSPAHLSRYDNVDVLSLLDPNWLENTQAAVLVRMCRDATEPTSHHAERGVSVLAA